jgi:hypothetical protein
MADRIEHDPSEIAPVAGEYELPSIFGSATGGRVCVMQGHLFPTAPSGHKWALLEQDTNVPAVSFVMRETDWRLKGRPDYCHL